MEKKILLLVFAFLSFSLFYSCEDGATIDPNVEYLGDKTIAFVESSYAISEDGGPQTVNIFVNQKSSSPITVGYTIEPINGAPNQNEVFSIENPNEQYFTIPADQYTAEVVILPVNDDVGTGTKTYLMKLTSISSNQYAFDTDYYETIEAQLIFGDDDCAGPAPGSYAVSGTNAATGGSSGGPISDYTASVDISGLGCDGDITKYRASDITFGFYDVAYTNGAPNPGVFTVNLATNQIEIIEAESPDVVYGGDSFFGTGVYDPVANTLSFSWANSYGDSGDAFIQL